MRHCYTIETLTSALNIYSSDKEKSSNIKEYIRLKGYTIKPIQFGKSSAEYEFDKENGIIYQRIGSIKYCNDVIAEELYALKDNKYASFVDLVIDIKKKTSVNSRQLQILIVLNFFSDYGSNKKLLQIIELFDKFYEKNNSKNRMWIFLVSI